MTPITYLNKAERALRGARLLLDANEYEGACNRAYYAMHDAAQAALIFAGNFDYKVAKTHRGLIAAFGIHLVQAQKLPRELGRALNQVEQVRLLADYTGDEIENEQAAWAVQQATLFIKAVRNLITQQQ